MAQDKLLGADEHALIRTRTHAKALIRPTLVLIILGAAAGAGAAAVPGELRPVGPLVLALLALLLAIWWVLLPFLRWWTTTYTLTNRRLVTRSGILNKIGKDLPLNRIHDVSYECSLLDRMLGCGTLNVQTAAEDGSMVLSDVPDVQRVHAEITGLLFGDHGAPRLDGPR